MGDKLMETQKTLADLSAYCLATSRRAASEKKYSF